MALIDTLHNIMQENQDAQKPADIVYGTVISASPLSIQPDISMPPLPASGLILTSGVVAKTAQVQGGQGTVIINEGLSAGDRVIMLRVLKGNGFIVLSKVQQ